MKVLGRRLSSALVALVLVSLMVSSAAAYLLLMGWSPFWKLEYAGPPKAVASTILKTYPFESFEYGGQVVVFKDWNTIEVNTIASVQVSFYVDDASDLSGLEFFPEVRINYGEDTKLIPAVGVANAVSFVVSGSTEYAFGINIKATAKYYATEDEAGWIQIFACVETPP